MKRLMLAALVVALAACANSTSITKEGGTLSDLQQPRYGYRLLDILLPF